MSSEAEEESRQRRGALRFGNIAIGATIRPRGHNGETLEHIATVCNLSATGALLALPEPLNVGDDLEVEFSTPARHPFVFHAKVVRVSSTRDGRWEAGVRFGFMFNDETNLILWLFAKTQQPAG